MVLNNGPASYDLDVPLRGLFADTTTMQDLWAGGGARVDEGRLTGLTLPPRAGAVLAAEGNLG